jgi:photosystem II stability/assembly factor-like uncharacterized protein
VAPQPATPSITPTAAPSLIPAAAPSLIPAVTPSPLPPTVAPTAAPTRAPTREPVQPTAEVLIPVWDKTINLGQADFENLGNSSLIALDDQAGRLYVSLSPSRTVVLDANSLTSIGEIPFGGALSVNPTAQSLYIGVPGGYAYQPDGAGVMTPAELKLVDTTDLTLLRSVVVSAESSVQPQVAIDPVNNKAYITQNGVTIADATTLETQGTLSGTFAIPGVPVPNYSAVEAAIDPQRQRLFVSLNNGIPGSNNGNVTSVYDLTSGHIIAQDGERSVSGFAVDEATGEVISPRSHIATRAIVKYGSQGDALKRLDGLSGLAQVDSLHDRVYVFARGEAGQVVTFDRDLNLVGVSTYPAGGTGAQFAIVDPQRDRLYVLQGDGKLIVLKGHAGPSGLAPLPAPDHQAVFSIIPSSTTSGSIYALLTPDEFTTDYGALFLTRNDGATWNAVNNWPLYTAVRMSDTLFAAIYLGPAAGLSIWRSSNDGTTWQPASHGLTDLAINRIIASPDFEHDGTLFALSKRGVFHSTDRGDSWTSLADRYAPLLQDLTVNFNAIALSPNFAQDNTVLIGQSSGLWRSIDRGETWTKIEGGPAANRLAFSPDGSIVLALNYDGVHRSDDGGLTWRVLNDGLDPANSTIGEAQIADREAVVLVTRFDQPGALYRLPLNETVWQPMPIEADVSAFDLRPDGTLLIGTADGTVRHIK